MKKKVLACTLAMATILGSSFTAFAAEISDMAGAGEGQEVTGESTMNLPVISVTVPTTADITINPFQMEFETTEEGGDGTKIKSTDAVYSATQEITSDSNVDIVINVEKLKAVPSDGVTLSTKTLTATASGTKQLYLTLDVKDSTADKATSVVIPGIPENDSKTKEAAKTGLATLAANKNGDESDDTKATFRVSGTVIANPTKTNEDKTVSADPWTSSDKVNISMKFTFTPQVAKDK